jgi:hypothetical protein
MPDIFIKISFFAATRVALAMVKISAFRYLQENVTLCQPFGIGRNRNEMGR